MNSLSLTTLTFVECSLLQILWIVWNFSLLIYKKRQTEVIWSKLYGHACQEKIWCNDTLAVFLSSVWLCCYLEQPKGKQPKISSCKQSSECLVSLFLLPCSREKFSYLWITCWFILTAVNAAQVKVASQDSLVFHPCSLQDTPQPSSSVCVPAGWRGGDGEEGPYGWGGGELGPRDASPSTVGRQSVFQLWG